MSGPYSLVTMTSSVGSPFSAIASSSITISAAGWGGTWPTNLSNALDGNTATATGYGITFGGSNKGWFLFDLGQEYENVFIQTKFGICMEISWAGGDSNWFAEVEGSPSLYAPLWIIKNFKAGSDELIANLGLWTRGQRIRMGCEDNGNGQSKMRIYSFRAWSVTLP